MTDTIRLFRPALLVALGAAILTSLAGILSLFVISPPTVEMLFHGRVSLASVIAIDEIFRDLMGERCSHLDWPVVCRLDSITAIANQLMSTRTGTIRLAFIGFGVTTASLFAFFFAYADTPLTENVQVLAGRRIETGAYAARALRESIRRFGKPRRDDLWLLPEVQLNEATTARNVLLVGSQGAGKTALLRAYIEMASLRGRLFVFDAKGDMMAGLPADDSIFVAPQDARSWALDIGREITNPLIAREFAAKCVPISQQDPMWAQGTRAVLADTAMALRARLGDEWSWAELANAALSSTAEIREMLLEAGAKSAALLNFGQDPEDNRTLMSIIITLWVTALGAIEPLARAWSEVESSRRFTVRDWLAQGSPLPRTLLFQKSSDYPELSNLVGSFLAERVAAAALAADRRRPGTERLTLALDEFPEASIDRLPRLLALGREFLVTTIASVQDLGQISIQAGSGEKQGSVIEARFGIRIILRLEPGETTKRICEMWIGKRRMKRRRDATVDELAKGLTKPTETVWEDTIAQNVLTDELGVFETRRGKRIRVLVVGFPTLAIVDLPLTTWADRREAHVPASWIDEGGQQALPDRAETL